MRLTRIGVLSAGKLMGILYALLGLIFGAIVALVSLVGGASGAVSDDLGAGMLLGYGVAAIFILPLLYGCIGFVGGLLTAALYNIVAGLAGGVEIELTQ